MKNLYIYIYTVYRFGSCWSSFPRNASFSSFGFVRRAICRRHSYKWKRWKCAKFEKFYSFFLMAHYNIGFGLMDESGHVDFYINGGDNQPECSIISFQYDIANLISSLRKEIPCSHDRAVSLFNDALLPNSCQSVGYQCASIDAFKRVKRIYICIFNNFILLRVIIHKFTGWLHILWWRQHSMRVIRNASWILPQSITVWCPTLPQHGRSSSILS